MKFMLGVLAGAVGASVVSRPQIRHRVMPLIGQLKSQLMPLLSRIHHPSSVGSSSMGSSSVGSQSSGIGSSDFGFGGSASTSSGFGSGSASRSTPPFRH